MQSVLQGSEGVEQLRLGVERWKLINLTAQRSELDDQAMQIDENDQRSLKARKALQEFTRELKRCNDSDKLRRLGSVMRAYQEEINQLTQRGKYAEKSFLTLYRSLFGAPDPAPFMEATLDAEERFEREKEAHATTKKQLHEYAEEFEGLRNQDVTIRRLELQNKEYQEQMEGRVQEQAEAIRREMEAELQEQQRLHAARLKSLQEELAVAVTNQQATQALLFQASTRADQGVAATEGEADMLRDEIERLMQCKAALDSEMTQLTRDIAELRKTKPASHGGSLVTEEFEAEVTQLRGLLESARDTLRKKEITWQTERAELTERAESEQEESDRARQEAATLQTKLSSLPPLEEVKRLRDIIKGFEEVEYGVVSEHLSPAERLMLRKRKLLEAEVTRLKLDNTRQCSTIQTANESIVHLTQQNEAQRVLVQKLESDLGRAQSVASRPAAAASTGDKDDADHTEAGEGGAEQGSDCMLDIVVGQRERLTEALTKIESEKSALSDEVKQLRVDVDRHRKDNLNLYEKLCYERNYKRGVTTKPDISLTIGRRGAAVDETERKYEQILQASSNPLKAFRATQQAVRLRSLPLTERWTLWVGRIVLTRRTTRTVLFFYVLALHILVFITLYTHTFTSHCDYHRATIAAEGITNSQHIHRLR